MSQLPLDPGRRIYSVSELTAAVREALEARLGGVWVEGELSNLRVVSSGHVYFTLKDEGAQIRAVLFKSRVRRLRFAPADGLHVLAFANLEIYAARGEYQLVCEVLEPRGRGALQLAFEQLKGRLAAEGLFEAGRKRPLPTLPRRVGLITSPTGAAVRDFLRVVTRRFADLHVVVYPVRVQGDTAPLEIARGIQRLNRMGDLDVLVLARGGGSLEDLWAFNEETVARAIAGSKIPVISAVGHETDVTIADFVADLRAPTPSAAAELVVREKVQLVATLTGLRDRLERTMRQRVRAARERMDAMGRRRVLTDPARPLREWSRRLDELGLRLQRGLALHRERVRARLARAERTLAPARLEASLQHERRHLRQLGARLVQAVRVDVTRRKRAVLLAGTVLGRAPARETDRHRRRLAPLADRLRRAAADHRGRRRQTVEALAARLDSLSPLACLARGYSICMRPSGEIITRAEQVEPAGQVTVRLRQGRLYCRVEEVRREGEGDGPR